MSCSLIVEGGWGFLVDNGDSLFLSGWRTESVLFGFWLADMMNVRAVRNCT